MKSSQAAESYNNEFVDLQKQLFDISRQTFNGVSLFANFATDSSGVVDTSTREFKGDNTKDNTIEIFTSSEGSSGSKVSLYKVDCSQHRPSTANLTTAQTGASVTGTVFGLFRNSSATLSGSATEISLNSAVCRWVFRTGRANIVISAPQTGGGCPD